MTQQSKDQQQKTGQTHPSQEKAKEEVGKQKQKSAVDEVAGRHRNDGKNDNAGHKTSR